MLFTRLNINRKLWFSLILMLSFIMFTGCTNGGDSNSNEEENAAEHEEDGEHDMEENDHEHEHEDGRIPNPDGAAISLLSPTDGTTFSEGEEINVEIEVSNFELGVDGNHWHVYVDGTSWGMVMGGNTSQSLNGVEPGEHKIEVYIAGGDHIEFEDGDSISVTVE